MKIEKWTWYKKLVLWIKEKVTGHDRKIFKEWKRIATGESDE